MRRGRAETRIAQRLWRMCLVNGRPHAGHVLDVTDTFISSARRGTPIVVGQFVRLARRDAARHSARVESATALGAADRADVLDALARRYSRRLETVFVVDERLIGGMRITVGSDVFDGSVQAHLAAIDASV